jgi:hypothetical protein
MRFGEVPFGLKIARFWRGFSLVLAVYWFVDAYLAGLHGSFSQFAPGPWPPVSGSTPSRQHTHG